MERSAGRRHAAFSNMARQFGWTGDVPLTEFEAGVDGCIAAVQLSGVGADDLRKALVAVYALDDVADATYDGSWPRGCRSLADLANLTDGQLGRIGVASLGQRVRIKRLAASATPSAPALPPTQFRMEGELSAVPWAGAPDVYAAWKSVNGEVGNAWMPGAAAVAATGAIVVLTADIGWFWCLALPAMVVLVGWASRRGVVGRSAGSLLIAVILHFLLGLVFDPGTPELALVSGAIAVAYVVSSATWVGLGHPPTILVTQFRPRSIPTIQDIATQLMLPLLPDQLATLGLTSSDLPEASDRTLHNAGLVSPEFRAAFRNALMPQAGTAVPMWRQFWPASLLGCVAAAWMVLSVGLAMIQQDRMYENLNLNENRMRTQLEQQRLNAATASSWLCDGKVVYSNGCPENGWFGCSCEKMSEHR